MDCEMFKTKNEKIPQTNHHIQQIWPYVTFLFPKLNVDLGQYSCGGTRDHSNVASYVKSYWKRQFE